LGYKFKTPQELQDKVNAYFEACDNHKTMKLVGLSLVLAPDPKPYTFTGLALAIGLSSRNALLQYVNPERGDYYEIIKEARSKVHVQWEEKLQRLGNNGGVMFNLVNAVTESERAYTNKQEVNIGGQPDNPLLVNDVTANLTVEQMLRMREIYDEADADTD